MTEKRVDPEDGASYTYDELCVFYKRKYKQKVIDAYWSETCIPTRAKPKAKAKAKVKASPKVVVDLSVLEKGAKLHAKAEDGVWYVAEVVALKKKGEKPVKVNYLGYTATSDEWLGADRLRSKLFANDTKEKKPDHKVGAYSMKMRNIGLMKAEKGYDVTIVCCSDDQTAAFWQNHLDASKGKVIPEKSTAIAVDEDWPGGAGNFLGTLYAWKKACDKLKQTTGRDLADELQKGASVALFHTAGKGTRMAPLPGGENNNKPGVKLPVPGPASILESVIRQTGAYAESRKSRLSVFWGDQIFVPSVSAAYVPAHHADIICGLGPMPSAEEWVKRGLESYGLIAARKDGSVAAMLEKVNHATATASLEGLEGVDRVGTSLGSFSLSSFFVKALVEHFSKELASKAGKMDTDPHLWMAVTLGKDAYADLMVKKGIFESAEAKVHHERVAALLASFDVTAGGLKGLFGTVNVGLDLSWWDFGLIKLYQKNCLLITEDLEDAKLARAFFGIKARARVDKSSAVGKCVVDAASVVSTSSFSTGSVSSSSILGVHTGEIKAEGAVLVNCCAKKIVAGKGAVAYNVVDKSDEGLVLGENEVRVGIFSVKEGQSYFEMRSNVATIDGGKTFKERVCGNERSFQEVYDLNCGVDVTACGAAAKAARQSFAEVLAKL